MTFDPKDSLGFQCVQTYKAFEKALAERLKGSSISPTQFIALAHLVALGSMPQNVLASHLSIAPASVVSLVDRMERDGWLRREPSAHDRRVKQLVVTKKARRVWKTLSIHSEAIVHQAYKGIDSQEILITQLLLEKLRINLAVPEP